MPPVGETSATSVSPELVTTQVVVYMGALLQSEVDSALPFERVLAWNPSLHTANNYVTSLFIANDDISEYFEAF